jgi:hypothetical protein
MSAIVVGVIRTGVGTGTGTDTDTGAGETLITVDVDVDVDELDPFGDVDTLSIVDANKLDTVDDEVEYDVVIVDDCVGGNTNAALLRCIRAHTIHITSIAISMHISTYRGTIYVVYVLLLHLFSNVWRSYGLDMYYIPS